MEGMSFQALMQCKSEVFGEVRPKYDGPGVPNVSLNSFKQHYNEPSLTDAGVRPAGRRHIVELD